MTEPAIGFNKEGYEEYKQIAREVSRRIMNEGPHRGRWQQREGGGSGGGHTIWFTITDVLCPDTDYVEQATLVVAARIYNQSCTGVPPGANDDGTYSVYDDCSHLYGLTPSDLMGTKGKATYGYPLTGDCTPKWYIDELCAQPECE
jgi:hypothetical protein